ncbi:MAG: hypothetical protein A3J93_03770 [Candidatus Magasanikbacteria bacterium RIFOXYC2_FULL_42_28]|uniref:Gcp-like domain-containing protein n=1 Tax=Candidatus Magasanikbacteria bacterium RIFOXYC2_FULL_42_28 TaxID=1798704 RepID=A0A1F6NUL4_9BACT|nr:MAG: hypothetical protein A3J93_03770 [Candidatus Magasanikbacteria bacterium RIFOXYC2_FULL_42_28]
MFLVIDSSAPDQVNLSLWLNTVWVHGYFLASAPLLVSIDKFLKQQQKTVADLKGVVVVVGRGRFTATRVATTVANTLAYVLNITVIAVTEIDWEKLPEQIRSAPTNQYASALYSGEAHIGRKK